jgi:hypothetical protein
MRFAAAEKMMAMNQSRSDLMLRAVSSIFVFGLVALGCSEFAAHAAAEDWKPADGFISLYNGKDLTGWGYADGELFDGKTEASDGRYTAKGERWW